MGNSEFYLDYLGSGRTVAYVDEVVVNIRQHDSASRLTHLFDHFEPFNTGSFFADKKRELAESIG